MMPCLRPRAWIYASFDAGPGQLLPARSFPGLYGCHPELRGRKAGYFLRQLFYKVSAGSALSRCRQVDEVSSAMTSGTVYPVGLFEELGVFMEELFVWGIDCEYCWRAARKGVRTVCFKNILLQHDLGYQKKKHRLLGKEVFPNEYPPARTYYNVRNGMVLHRLYPESLNLKAHLRYHLYKRIVFVLLYEKQKIAKWKALWDGYRDGKRGKLGERGQ